jgi:hypothetical protein
VADDAEQGGDGEHGGERDEADAAGGQQQPKRGGGGGDVDGDKGELLDDEAAGGALGGLAGLQRASRRVAVARNGMQTSRTAWSLVCSRRATVGAAPRALAAANRVRNAPKLTVMIIIRRAILLAGTPAAP